MPLFFLLLLVGLAASQSPCDSPVNFGTVPCSNSSSVRFHLDAATKRCLAFRFSGCGGNGNNFESLSLCRQRCIPMDHLTCPGNTPEAKNENGTTSCGGPLKCKDSSSYCHAHETGICCSIEARDKVRKDHEKTCPDGKEKYVVEEGGHKRPLMGKSCDSNFCPSEFDCKKGFFYAYCCKK